MNDKCSISLSLMVAIRIRRTVEKDSAFCDRHLDVNCTAKFRRPYAYGFAVASRLLRWGVAATDNNERPSTVSRRNLHILNEGKCIFITGPV